MTPSKSRELMLCLLLVTALPSASLAQVGTAAGISGAVQDASNAVLPGATVTATHPATGARQTTVTDAAGRYQFPQLAPGSYDIEASLSGFKTEVRIRLELTVGRTEVVNFVLSIGEVSERVEVQGGAPLVDLRSSSVTGLVSEKEVRELPLNGRSFDQLIVLSAGAGTFVARNKNAIRGNADQFTVGGSRPAGTKLMVDGAEFAGAGGGNTNVNTASGKLLGVEGVQEFVVIVNNADASFGKKSGGQVNIVTRSGGNGFSGSAFEFLRNDVFDSKGYFDREKPDLRRNNYGFALGGPIVRNHAFFFVNFEQLKERRGSTVIETVPTAAARNGLLPTGAITVHSNIRPLLDLYPLPNGVDFGDGTGQAFIPVINLIDDTFWVARMDHQVTASHSLFGRYLTQKGTAHDRQKGIGQFEEIFPVSVHLLTVGSKHTFSSRLLNQFTATYNGGRLLIDIDALDGVSLPAEMFIAPDETKPGGIAIQASAGLGGSQIPTLGGGLTVGAQDRFVHREVFQIQDQVSLVAGAHAFQFGGDIQRIHSDEFQGTQKRGLLEFASLSTFLQGRPNRVSGPTPGSDATKFWRQTYFAVYAQDNWRATNSLSLNLGVRYEFMSNPTEVNGRITAWGRPATTRAVSFPRSQPSSIACSPTIRPERSRLGSASPGTWRGTAEPRSAAGPGSSIRRSRTISDGTSGRRRPSTTPRVSRTRRFPIRARRC